MARSHRLGRLGNLGQVCRLGRVPCRPRTQAIQMSSKNVPVQNHPDPGLSGAEGDANDSAGIVPAGNGETSARNAVDRPNAGVASGPLASAGGSPALPAWLPAWTVSVWGVFRGRHGGHHRRLCFGSLVGQRPLPGLALARLGNLRTLRRWADGGVRGGGGVSPGPAQALADRGWRG